MRFLAALAFAAPLFATPLFAQCTYVVAPLNFSIGAAQTPGTVHVTQTAGSACGSYSVTVPVETTWLHITSSPIGGIPPSDVTFTADENPGATTRSGLMHIANNDVTVTQSGASCTFGVTPTSQNFPVGGGDNTFQVQANCAWQATSNAGWITLKANGTSGVPIGYSAAARIPRKSAAGRMNRRKRFPAAIPPPAASWCWKSFRGNSPVPACWIGLAGQTALPPRRPPVTAASICAREISAIGALPPM